MVNNRTFDIRRLFDAGRVFRIPRYNSAVPAGFHILPQYQPIARAVGLDAEAVFEHPDIVAWRKLPDRENCTLDTELEGRPLRLHIKRYLVPSTGVNDEVRGIELLKRAQIPTVPLVGWGHLADGRSFVINEDLSGYRDSERRVAEGFPFALLFQPTLDLAVRLHDANLHHRDLYLCHFFSRVSADNSSDVEMRLIDAARVAPMNPLRRRRWIVKDLAQFWYSTLKFQTITDEMREAWLSEYARRRKILLPGRLQSAVRRKAGSIARHDAKVRQSQPTRNVSLPEPGGIRS